MRNFLKILHVEDNPSDADLLKAVLSAEGIACEMERVDTRHDFTRALGHGGFDLIISDHTMPSFDGLTALSIAQETCPDVPFLFVSGTIGEEVAIESLKKGARDYVLKNRLSHVGAKIRRTLKEAREQTLRQQAEKALRESERLLRSVWNGSRDGIRLTDQYGMVVAVNEAYCTLTGLPASDLIGNRFEAGFAGEPDGDKALDDYLRRFASRQFGSSRQSIQFKRGPGRVVEINHSFVEAPESEPLLLAVFREVEAGPASVAENLSTEKLRSTALATGMAHDINNTLAPILLAASLLREKLTQPDQLRLLNILETSAQHGAEMISRVLSFANGEVGEMDTVHLRKLIAEIAKHTREALPESIEVICDIPEEPLEIKGNVRRLREVLVNLIANARDAMPGGGRLTLRVENVRSTEAEAANMPKGPRVVITVADNGTGMEPEVQAQLFEPFFTTKARRPGRGLGLPATLGLVKGHGGVITVESEAGRGSQFHVHLPALLPEPPVATLAEEEDSGRGKGELILLVEDEDLVREVLRRSLEFFGYRVITAVNGQQGLARFNAQPGEIQLVLTDMMMPVMDGPTMIRNIRRADPEVHIVAISGGSLAENQFQGPDMRVEAFLAKPFPTEKLVAVIKNLLKTPAASTAGSRR